MRLDIAESINAGDIVYDCFRQPFKVISKVKFQSISGKLNSIAFIVEEPAGTRYNYTDLYLENMEDESDEETSWVYWASSNKDILVGTDLDLIRQAYIAAFANGYEYKRNIRYQEMMQK
jgi:hypothetical protein